MQDLEVKVLGQQAREAAIELDQLGSVFSRASSVARTVASMADRVLDEKFDDNDVALRLNERKRQLAAAEQRLENVQGQIDAFLGALENSRQFLAIHQHDKLDVLIQNIEILQSNAAPNGPDKTIVTPGGQVVDPASLWQPGGVRPPPGQPAGFKHD